jgi:hypothetical protein
MKKFLSIERYERCLVLSLPAFGKYKIEFVYAPRGYEIAPHTHSHQDIKLIFLFGHNIRFYRKRPLKELVTFWARFSNIGKSFTILANDIHYFKVSNWPLVFMNIEKWHIKPTSAAKDLQLTQTQEYAKTL